MSSLDNLRKAARRWLEALRAHDPEAEARLTRAMPAAPQRPVLRDVQHALAREHGHDSWLDLKRAFGDRQGAARSPDVAQFEQLAADFLAAWQSGDPNALKRLAAYFRHMVTWDQLRAEVDRQLARLPESERPASLTLTDVHRFLAKTAGFGSWRELVDTLSGTYTAAGKSNRHPIPREREDAASGMLRPVELRVTLPMELPEGAYATTDLVWQMLAAAKTGDLDAARTLVAATPGLTRCEYNYMPPLDVAKWGRYYYFKHADIGAMLLERGMNPNHMTWHRTTLLHDMAGEGNMEKATLLLKHGADINPVDDEFRTTPLGFAARWGRRELVRLLLDHGADPNVAGAGWATPLAWAEKKGHWAIADDLRATGAR